MEKFIDKISSFHLLTNLVPGTVFCILVRRFTCFTVPTGTSIADYITFYFIGVVISRFGSILIAPLYKKLKIVEYVPYSQFLTAEKKDKKITEFSEANNLYRALLSSAVLFSIIYFYDILRSKFPFLSTIKVPVLCIALIVLFTLSYKKQTTIVRKRVEHNCRTEEETNQSPKI